jgi:hypothetical protein
VRYVSFMLPRGHAFWCHCGWTFDKQEALKRHLEIWVKPSWQCHDWQCMLRFKTEHEARDHIASRHSQLFQPTVRVDARARLSQLSILSRSLSTTAPRAAPRSHTSESDISCDLKTFMPLFLQTTLLHQSMSRKARMTRRTALGSEVPGLLTGPHHNIPVRLYI